LRPNTRAGSQKNIHAHYDLGNAFYERWLDPSMTYSAARWETGKETLQEAQTVKYRTLCDQMGLRPGDHVLEIGCGWGGFAEYAAKERGAKLTCLTISKEQLAFARARMQRLGLNEQVEIRYQDYRDVSGQFDRIASIEMFEAVGERFWPGYFAKLGECLKPGGTAGLQIITIAEAMFDTYRRSVDFIQKYVFPGGMLPSVSVLKSLTSKASLDWRGHVAFGRDYGRTLDLWREAFDAEWDTLNGLGFDERFRRLWRYYLGYCEAGFKGGSIDVVQLTLARP
jgi:cyclopropane-fatty-acyl-phospholipid synthase